jgi:cbb3-type cytochrome oxidase cytochrome c subunit
MALNRRDWIFIVLAGLLLGLLVVKGTNRRAKKLPGDAVHRPFAASLAQGVNREIVEKGCPACHNPVVRPLSPEHPPKEQCLICHGP